MKIYCVSVRCGCNTHSYIYLTVQKYFFMLFSLINIKDSALTFSIFRSIIQ